MGAAFLSRCKTIFWLHNTKCLPSLYLYAAINVGNCLVINLSCRHSSLFFSISCPKFSPGEEIRNKKLTQRPRHTQRITYWPAFCFHFLFKQTSLDNFRRSIALKMDCAILKSIVYPKVERSIGISTACNLDTAIAGVFLDRKFIWCYKMLDAIIGFQIQ